MQATSARPVGGAAAALAELVRFRTVSSRAASTHLWGRGTLDDKGQLVAVSSSAGWGARPMR